MTDADLAKERPDRVDTLSVEFAGDAINQTPQIRQGIEE